MFRIANLYHRAKERVYSMFRLARGEVPAWVILYSIQFHAWGGRVQSVLDAQENKIRNYTDNRD